MPYQPTDATSETSNAEQTSSNQMITPDLRSCIVQILIKSISPPEGNEISKLEIATNLENSIFEKSRNRNDYYRFVADEMAKINK